ncbi:MAG: CotH kinase family protein, partial [Bacteroidaceae bacterium]|nr:CotH kinase family protein [Bacteroidaceae bacterium]
MVAQVDTYDVMCQQLSEKSLPLVNLLVDVDALVRSDFISAEIEITDPQRRTDPHSETVHYACGVRIRGGYAASQEKKSYAIKLYDAEGEDFDAPIFGIRNENSWIFDAMAIDRIRMRNRVCFDLWNQISKTPYDTPY